METTNNIEYRYGIYARKSSESEDKQVQSIERQVDDFLEIVEREGLQIQGEPFKESQSAFSPGREDFNQLVAMTYKKEINAWLCWHPNRLSRNPVDAGTIIYLMDQGLLHHIKTPTRVYFNNPTDKMMLGFEFMMSKKDSDDKSGFVKSGLKKRYKKGLPTGKATIGFLNDKTKEKGDRGWLVDEERFPKIKMLLNRFLEGKDSVSSITQYAREELCLTSSPGKRQGNRLVGKAFVHNILRNPIFAGYFFAKNEDGSGYTKTKLSSSLPRAITEDEHQKILTILGKKATPKTQKHIRTYVGFIRGLHGETIGVDVTSRVTCDCKYRFAHRNKDCCPRCGVRIGNIQKPKFEEYTHYYNVKRRKTQGIKAKTVREETVDDFMLDYIKNNISISSELTEWAKRHLHELKDKEIDEVKQIAKAQSRERSNLEQEKKKVREMYRKGMSNEEEFNEDMEELKKREQQLQLSPIQIDWFSRLEEILNLGHEIQNIIKNGTTKEKRLILTKLSSNLTWDEEKLSISNAKWMNAYIKGRKRVLQKYSMFEPEKTLVTKEQNALLQASCPTLLQWLDDVRTEILAEFR